MPIRSVINSSINSRVFCRMQHINIWTTPHPSNKQRYGLKYLESWIEATASSSWRTKTHTKATITISCVTLITICCFRFNFICIWRIPIIHADCTSSWVDPWDWNQITDLMLFRHESPEPYEISVWVAQHFYSQAKTAAVELMETLMGKSSANIFNCHLIFVDTA